MLTIACYLVVGLGED